MAVITLSDPRYDALSQVGYALGQKYAEDQQQKQYMQALQDIAKLRKEQQDLSKPNAAQNQATFDVANSDKYRYDIDQQHPDDENIKGMDQLLYGADKLANLKRTYELNNGNTEYQSQIAAAANKLRDPLTAGAQKYGLNVGSDISAEDYQKGLDALKTQRNQQATAWADRQNPGHMVAVNTPVARTNGQSLQTVSPSVATNIPVVEANGQVLQATNPATTGVSNQSPQTVSSTDYFTGMDKDIDARKAQIEQRQQQLGLGGSESAKRMAIIQGLAKYSPQVAAAGLKFYDDAKALDKQAEIDNRSKAAVAAAVKEIYSAKTPEQRYNALTAFSLLTGNSKELADLYKAYEDGNKGRYKDISTNLGNAILQGGFDTRTGKYTSGATFGVGIAPKDELEARVKLSTNEADNRTKIAIANIEGSYILQKAGIDYSRAVEVARLSKDNKLNPADKEIVDTVSDALTDPEKWQQLNSTDLGQQFLQRYRQIAGTGSGLITDKEHDLLYNDLVFNKGYTPAEAQKAIRDKYY